MKLIIRMPVRIHTVRRGIVSARYSRECAPEAASNCWTEG